ncbi:hypothetical protein Lal_00009947 [Lupinus albus]|uniref:Uncharacterized protein n=1 Tax=Lupinus albus TaxID=3870 RepID=A0A6A5LI14_LUPAL|nr:putative protein kinase RLK-Pelle-LRR-XI-1 family [Lupinus albus]KAF1859363.1 hypothetical protein Lal_00009947 [Lupinus albus]
MTKVIQSCLKMTFFYVLSFLFLTYAKSQSQSVIYDHEQVVLVRIKQYLNNPSFLSHWTSSNSSHCLWPEIKCTNGSVTTLALINTNITQTLPPFICNLKNLTCIDFQLNYIPGEFPGSLYNCPKLEHLDLSQNYFVGKIPDDIDTLANLSFLSLGANNFSGDIPVSIGKLKKLTNLQLYQCPFNGTIPDEIGNLSNLETLYLFSNSMLPPTKLPSSFTKLKKLKVFDMHDSNLVGEIPETIGEIVALENLDLSGNGLSGQIPNGLLKLKNLSILYLYKNSLSGELPVVVESFNIVELDLSQNNLIGKIPEDFGKLKKLTTMNLQINQLSGEVPESIGLLPDLIDFLVFLNNLSGNLPPNFGRFSKLETFQIASNSFSGRLPQNLCYNGRLVGLTTYDNNLSGELPETLGNCSSLQFLRIENNKFSGNIPSGMWTLKNLSTIKVNQNKFTGVLPERISLSISDLGISDNNFSGRLPTEVSSWKNLVMFNASNNFFSGSIPHDLTSLPQLTTLLLDQNQLTGPLPLDIISWKSLIAINLSHNQLSGEIPNAIGRLPALNILDLSENKISGQIPPQLALMRPTNLNLSSNQLTGKIPSDFENLAYSRSFLNNSGLCADTTVLNLTLCSSAPQRVNNGSSVSQSHALLITVVVLASLVALLSSLFVIRVYRKRKQELLKSWKLTSFQRLSFTKSNIVSSMTEHNIIGSGGYGEVYRVAFDGLGGYVAVKKISRSRRLDKKLEDSFLAEVEILSNIRHNNIVKLLCCISSEDSLLLVYEYHENHSLDRWLHNKNKSSSAVSIVHYSILDWPRRLHIAIGAAQGLCYMHHDCSPPVIHRDVKTSNILLDSEFNAKVADFGLARMLIKPEELATMSAVAGTFGYIAPEYAQTTRVNEKIDVYSFGVVLLELTTGKEANHGDEYSSLAEWAWSYIEVENNIEDVLDEEIKEACYIDEMCRIFKLGVMCTATLPTSRPSMKEVIKILQCCNHPIANGDKNLGFYDHVPLLKT